MADPLHDALRHVIRLCWRSLKGQQVFKCVVIDESLAQALPDDFSPEKQITNIVACGSSANRLCELLLGGNPLSDIMVSPDAIPLDQTERVQRALQEMRATRGYLLCRINIEGGGAGHSYIFLSKQHAAGQALKGLIYQTNVGCDRNAAFDLISWIDDAKSEVEVDLETHLSEISSGFKVDPADVYQRQYMLSSKPLKQYEVNALKDAAAGKDKAVPATFRIMWSVVDETKARKSLYNILKQVPVRKWPEVQPPPRVVLTHF